MHLAKFALTTTFFLALISSSKAQDERVYDSICFNLVKDENFFTKTAKETFGSQEGQALLAGVCTYFTGDPGGCTKTAATAGQIYSAVTKQSGSDTWGKIDPRAGYEICRGFIVNNDLSNTGDTFFSARVHRAGISWYTSWQVGTGKRSWIDTQIVLEQVPAGHSGQYECWPNKTLIAVIKGKNRYTSYEGESIRKDGLMNIGKGYPKCIDHSK